MEKTWELVFSGQKGALISVWGTSSRDVWAVGSDTGDGGGALVLHFDGDQWSRLQSGLEGNLWWVHGAGGAVYAGGEPGLFVRLGLQNIEVFDTPSARDPSGWKVVDTGLATDKALHSVWVDESREVWAVGGDVLVPPLGNGVLVHYGVPVAHSYRDIPVTLVHTRIDGGTGTDAEAGPIFEGGVPEASLREGGGSDVDAAETGLTVAVEAGPLEAGPDARPPSGSGLATCGVTTCDLTSAQCCVDRTGAVEPSCLALGTVCPNNSYSLTCDESTDCSSGLVCCAQWFIQLNAVYDVACVATCPDYVLCASDNECPVGSVCGPPAQVAGYQTCR